MIDTPQAYTVTAITRMIKGSLEEQFQGVWIEGEISGYLLHSSGHRYFSLKDENAVLKVTLWRSLGAFLKFEPKDGQKVLVYGDITVYEKGGSYQLNCKKVVPVGIGELELAFRQLYERLSQEGLFAQERKKLVPEYPTKIGIVTSPNGAAIRDIIQIAYRRNPGIELVIYPAKVQGDGAEKTIAEGIRYFNTRKDIDVIITGRGGGSLEDLWCFNTEEVVRAIVASKLPLVSAVGHEVDTTLSDLAADLRASTPSAAAEMIIWSRREYLDGISHYQKRQAMLLEQFGHRMRERLLSLIRRRVFTFPEEIFTQRQQFLDTLTRRLVSTGEMSLKLHQHRLAVSAARLDTLSPLKVMARGFSVTRSLPEKLLLKSVKTLHTGSRVETLLPDGTFTATIDEISRKQT